MSFTVGSVPYVNAIPLTWMFQNAAETQASEESPVKVIFDVPSKLPALLESGQADAVLVSSVDALRVPGRRMAAGVCIGSDGPVKSVRLFSKVPFSQIQTLALDAASMTSNRLARILLAELHEVRPAIVTREPNLQEMLGEADACVLIGDIGMTTDGTGLHVMDMGEAWRKLTGKPFVWAAWIGNDGLTPELVGWLHAAEMFSTVGRSPFGPRSEKWSDFVLGKDFREMKAATKVKAAPIRERLIQSALGHTSWTEAMIADYYDNVMVYRMEEPMLEGLREFRTRLLRNGFDDCGHFPALLASSFAMPTEG